MSSTISSVRRTGLEGLRQDHAVEGAGVEAREGAASSSLWITFHAGPSRRRHVRVGDVDAVAARRFARLSQGT